MPAWKSWAVDPPPRGRWVMASHPYVPATFQLDPATVDGGMDMSNVLWMDWTVPDARPLPIIPVLAFKQLFTPDEYVDIKASADHRVQQFLDMVNTPSVTSVTLTDALVSGGVQYLTTVASTLNAGAKILTPQRAMQILANGSPS